MRKVGDLVTLITRIALELVVRQQGSRHYRGMSESRQSEVVEVELRRLYERDDPDSDSWAATWGLEDSDEGIDDQADDVRRLVNDVINDIRRRWGADYDLTIEWSVDGWKANEELESLGVALPEELPAP
ncbi:hypothetical protein ACW2Q0_30765 [Nocardia sp. R16R-3T]